MNDRDSYRETYKEKFKREEMEHELQHEDEDMLRRMTPEERKKYLREEMESAALRAAHGWRHPR